jgi:ferric-dicitrate binding protein FerR (iron transport regulator)
VSTDRRIAQELRNAGARDAPSAAAMLRVRQAVWREYSALVARRQRRSRRWMVLAASVAVLTLSVVFTAHRSAASVIVAHVSRSTGDPVGLAPGQFVRSGQELTLPRGARALLVHVSGVELRVDEDSRLTFVDAAHVRLERGALYVDTDSTPHARLAEPLIVTTDWGEVRHVGTRFEVRVATRALHVRVRDGAVHYLPPNGQVNLLETGEVLDVMDGRITRSGNLATTDAAWDWTQEIAPPFDIEGRTLIEALDWFAHEGGFSLEFASPAARARASTIVLHGSTRGLRPRDALNMVMAGTAMSGVIESGRIRIDTH